MEKRKKPQIKYMEKTIFASTSSFGNYDENPIRMIQKAGFVFVSNPLKRKLTQNESIRLLNQYKPVGLIAGTEKLDREIISGSKSFLKVISRAGVGLDNVDLEAARELDIGVYRTPDAPTEAVGELAVGLMLAVLRKISTADRLIRSGNWKALMGDLIFGKIVGVVGIGRVGRHVGKILSAGFGAKVIGFDPFYKLEWPNDICLKMEMLNGLLRESDIVTIHIPGGAETKHLISRNEFNLMKKGAVIINTSRGGIIDEEALIDALNSNHIAGAGLDVFENEPYSGPLVEYDSVVLTMHMGSYAREARIKMECQAVENLLSGLKEKGVIT